jgi:hypothetical protein
VSVSVPLTFAAGLSVGCVLMLAVLYFAARWAMRRAVDPSRR